MFGEFQIRRVFAICLVVMLITWMVGQEPASPGVHLAYSLRSKELTLGEPVIVTFTIENGTGKTVRADLGKDRKGSFAFTIIRPDQQELALPAFSREGISRHGLMVVDPGQSFSEDLILNEWYQFTVAGQYRVRAVLNAPVVDADGRTVLEDHGSELQFTIGPRNVAQLGYLCAELVDSISRAQSYSEAAEGALKLSYVADPAAVPYLKRGLELDKLVEPILMTGLERIGDDSAVQVLIWSLQSGTPDTRLLARSALQRVYGATQSAGLRKQIEQALANGEAREK